jgi:hypothetical protein
MNKIDEIFDKITVFESREMTRERFRQAVTELMPTKKVIPSPKLRKKQTYIPYYGWCDVKGCENEGCSGGMVWPKTGYWTVCYHHSAMFREGKEQPEMKKLAIEREKRRGIDGILRKK